jgi:hypothetical protein
VNAFENSGVFVLFAFMLLPTLPKRFIDVCFSDFHNRFISCHQNLLTQLTKLIAATAVSRQEGNPITLLSDGGTGAQ